MDSQTLAFYRANASEWAAGFQFPYSPWIDAFLDDLAPGARILELGCGDGRDAARMVARGFDVHPSDGTPELAQLASARLGREVPVMRFAELDACEAFDAVWSQAALTHVPEGDLPGVLARIHRALKPGGHHWASYKDGNGGSRDQHGRFFSYIPAERLEGAYRAAGPWGEFALRSRDGTSYGRGPQVWHEVRTRK
jgi:SAM-dependent methyltransferase